MDNNMLIVALPWGLGLMLFCGLWLVEWFSVRRHQARVRRRLLELRHNPAGTPRAKITAEAPLEIWRNGHSPYYGLTWPATRTRSWQRRAR